jgi:hypothetical protein
MGDRDIYKTIIFATGEIDAILGVGVGGDVLEGIIIAVFSQVEASLRVEAGYYVGKYVVGVEEGVVGVK